MSIHGCSSAKYADKYAQIDFKDTGYLSFRDVPNFLQGHVKGNVALDYGCGPGRSAIFLANMGFLVDGVDINESMINLARQAAPKSTFQVLKEGRIPANDEQYDLVFSSWVLQEIGQKQKLVATLSEISRVLKKDGVVVLIVPSEALYGKDWLHTNAEFEENEYLKSGDRAKVLIKENNFLLRPYYWTKEDYREVLRDAGLDVILKHYPLGTDDDGFSWVNEKEVSPMTIYIVKKKKREVMHRDE